MSWDTHSLFGFSIIQSVTSQVGSTLILTVQAGKGTRFSTNQQVTLGPSQTLLTIDNAMVGRVTGISGDTLTIDYGVSNREGSSVQTINSSYVIGNGVTPKVLTDIETAIDAGATTLKSATTKVDVSASSAPTAGKILTATDGTHATWQTPSVATDGWATLSSTLAYSSADGHTFVVTSSADMTGSIGLGDKIKFTNNATTFYGIVTAIAVGTITIYGGTQYTVANSVITVPFYSHAKAPFGFNPRPDYWTEEISDTTARTTASPVGGTWYNTSTLSLAIPIGLWITEFEVACGVFKTASVIWNRSLATLSTANNSQSDIDFTTQSAFISTTSGPYGQIGQHYKRKVLSLAVKTTYYLNSSCETSSDTLYSGNENAKAFIRAICGYL